MEAIKIDRQPNPFAMPEYDIKIMNKARFLSAVLCAPLFHFWW